MPAAISAYSMAVAPVWSCRKRAQSLIIGRAPGDAHGRTAAWHSGIATGLNRSLKSQRKARRGREPAGLIVRSGPEPAPRLSTASAVLRERTAAAGYAF